MTDKEIIIKWKQGLSKELLSKIYKREFNRELRILRANPKHRHDGKYISNYELKIIVEIINSSTNIYFKIGVIYSIIIF